MTGFIQFTMLQNLPHLVVHDPGKQLPGLELGVRQIPLHFRQHPLPLLRRLPLHRGMILRGQDRFQPILPDDGMRRGNRHQAGRVSDKLFRFPALEGVSGIAGLHQIRRIAQRELFFPGLHGFIDRRRGERLEPGGAGFVQFGFFLQILHGFFHVRLELQAALGGHLGGEFRKVLPDRFRQEIRPELLRHLFLFLFFSSRLRRRKSGHLHFQFHRFAFQQIDRFLPLPCGHGEQQGAAA